MPVFRKRRSPNNQQENATSASAMSAMQNEIEWVSNAIRVAELASATGGLLPFPYLKGAADLFKTLLMPIKQMQQNQDDYKTFAVNVTSILQIFHEEIQRDPEAVASSLSSFEQDCKNFYSCLKDISDSVESFNNKHTNNLRRYFMVDRERDRLTHYQKKVDELRINLVLRGIIRLQPSIDTHDEINAHFEQVRLGDLNILRSTSNASVEHWEVQWRQETRTRMVRVYKGQNAIARFKAEKEWYTRIRHPSIMQLFGLITSSISPGLIFHNSWCIPIANYMQNSGPHILQPHVEKMISYYEGLVYLDANTSHHSFISWRPKVSDVFIGFENHDDGFMLTSFVSILDGRRVIALEWMPNVLQHVHTCQCDPDTIDAISLEEAAKIMEAICMPNLSEQLDTPSHSDLLWDFYGVVYVCDWTDVSPPGYPVYTGDILLANKRHDWLEASTAAMLGFIPCEEPLSCWAIREKLQDYYKLSSRVSIEDCGEYFRIRLPLNDASVSVAQNFETVVIEYDIRFSDPFTWKWLARAYVSQIGHISLQAGLYDTICLVIGFCWHLQIPTSVQYSTGIAGNKEIYFFISKPAAHDQDLKTYWSLNASGSEIINSSDILGTLDFTPPTRYLRVIDIDSKGFQSIWHAHIMFNIDPETNEGARILGLPLMKFGIRSDDESDEVDNKLEDTVEDAGEDVASFESAMTDEAIANSYYTADERGNESTGEAEVQSSASA